MMNMIKRRLIALFTGNMPSENKDSSQHAQPEVTTNESALDNMPDSTGPARITKLRNLDRLNELDIHLFLNPAPDVISECLEQFGHWEKTETEFFIDHIKEGDVVLDIGANIGYYSVIFSKLVGESGRVFAFEPDDENFRLLQENKILNKCENLSVFKAIVGKSSGISKLQLFSDENRGAHMVMDGSSEFLRAHADFIEKEVFHPRLAIDELFEMGAFRKVNFMKMDTQGSEPLVIAGANKTILENQRNLTIVMEFTPPWIETLHKINVMKYFESLRDLGFVASYIDTLKQAVLPVDDPAHLFKIVSEANGIDWPRDAAFVDLILQPICESE